MTSPGSFSTLAGSMSDTPATLIALLHGPDQPGLVARVAGWIFEQGGNILHADQHRDMEAGVFFQRVEWEPAFAKSADAAGSTTISEGTQTISASVTARFLFTPGGR